MKGFYRNHSGQSIDEYHHLLRGLVDRVMNCCAKGSWFKSHSGKLKNYYFWRNILIFLSIWKFQNLPHKTTASQTNFGLYNIGSDMHSFRTRAISVWQFSIGTPCREEQVFSEYNWNITNKLVKQLLYMTVQGVLIENCQTEIALVLKLCTSML